MNYVSKCILVLLSISNTLLYAQTNTAITSGVPWFDDKGKVVSAHGAGIIQDNGRFYLFGERHDDTTNVFAGFNCYSSSDLYNWKFENIVLPVQQTGKPGPNRAGERLCCSTLQATVYYVATNGIDENPGTKAFPLQTIQKAQTLVAPGDTVYVRGGTYMMQESQIASYTRIHATTKTRWQFARH